MCDDCMQYIQNIDLVLRDMQDCVSKNKCNLENYKSEFKFSLEESEKELKNLLEAIELRYIERLVKIDKAQKLLEKNLSEVKNIQCAVNEIESKNKVLINEVKESNEKISSELINVVKNQKQSSTTKPSFAEALRNNSQPPVIINKKPLIVKPKEKQSAHATKVCINGKSKSF